MRALLLLPLLLFACDRPAPAPKPEQHAGPVATRPAPPPTRAAGPAEDGRGKDDAANAATVLARYYALIEHGDYGGAWSMRSGAAGLDRERFAANFRSYETYRAQVGAPSLPVGAAGFDFVEVPVMITGRLRGGRAFSNGGSVTLRRAHDGPDRAWRIYTG